MQVSEYYETDILRFFSERPVELDLYQALFRKLSASFPAATVKVQKTQISFYGRHLFAAVSLLLRRRKEWPGQGILVTFGLPYRLDAPRIAMAAEPYPKRWTHHVVVSEKGQLDGELMGWLSEAWEFSESK